MYDSCLLHTAQYLILNGKTTLNLVKRLGKGGQGPDPLIVCLNLLKCSYKKIELVGEYQI